ncbi:2626_t:CDS:2, partial [Gigaspora rosea]
SIYEEEDNDNSMSIDIPNTTSPVVSSSTTIVYNETKKDVEMLINNNNSQNLCLISDGWSNLVREHWTNYILAIPKPVFYIAYPTNETRQNG